MFSLLLAVLAFWPPWISIESPVNPFDQSVRGAVFLVHVRMREGVPALNDLSASAEGMVNGSRQTVTVRVDATSQPGVFAVHKQWPATGSWLVVVTFAGHSSALVTIGPNGNVASVQVPMDAKDPRLPRIASAKEVDSTLASLSPTHSR
jgi:hypothetical protein